MPTTVSVLLVALLLVLVVLLALGAITYLVLRHPRLAAPLTVAGAWATALALIR
ncbi:hypothetical protein [Streptomyces termitum]|uniref:hypothetical protein n=1 Tax=Streptomyces termitum TaxID=67368 RepID=UPI0033ADFB7B